MHPIQHISYSSLLFQSQDPNSTEVGQKQVSHSQTCTRTVRSTLGVAPNAALCSHIRLLQPRPVCPNVGCCARERSAVHNTHRAPRKYNGVVIFTRSFSKLLVDLLAHSLQLVRHGEHDVNSKHLGSLLQSTGDPVNVKDGETRPRRAISFLVISL